MVRGVGADHHERGVSVVERGDVVLVAGTIAMKNSCKVHGECSCKATAGECVRHIVTVAVVVYVLLTVLGRMG